MFDFPIICTKCGWVLVGWMAREGGGQVTNCTGRGFLMRLGDVLKNIIVVIVMIENTVAAIIEMGATLYMRNNFVFRVFHNTTLHNTGLPELPYFPLSSVRPSVHPYVTGLTSQLSSII